MVVESIGWNQPPKYLTVNEPMRYIRMYRYIYNYLILYLYIYIYVYANLAYPGIDKGISSFDMPFSCMAMKCWVSCFDLSHNPALLGFEVCLPAPCS